MLDVQLYLADCLDKLSDIPTASVDAVITDSPYPCIKRDYGYWTVQEWWELIVDGVVPQVRRILKPAGSAVFILQPNSEHVGQMRGWLFEFQAWVCREWNMVQDAYWWNFVTQPTVHTSEKNGLMRPSLKYCVWAGYPHCYRNQANVLWSESMQNRAARMGDRLTNNLIYSPSGSHNRELRMRGKAGTRNGVVPYNLLPIANSDSQTSAGAHGHGAGTPLKLADWWARYICPPGGVVCDPFMGSGTMGIAAVQNGCNFIGIEKLPGPGYFETAQERIAEALAKARQMELAL